MMHLHNTVSLLYNYSTHQSFPSHTNLPMETTMFSSLSLLLLLCFFSMGYCHHESERCLLESLSALEPTRREDSEAGFTEYFDDNNPQFNCSGVVAFRQTIQYKGLVLPVYFNAHRILFIAEGKGYMGVVIPECQEIYQYFEEKENHTVKKHEHQRLHRFRKGDIVVVPAGVSHWFYNYLKSPIVTVSILDVRGGDNQLDSNLRTFRLGGGRGSSGPLSILTGFGLELLAASLGVSTEVAKKLQVREEATGKGQIVHVEKGLHVIAPGLVTARRGRGRVLGNWLGGDLCPERFAENIGDQWHADINNPDGGWFYSLNSEKFPLLDYLQLSADTTVLFSNASMAPHWNINAHSVVYITGGSGRFQVVDNLGRRVFDGELRPGQLVVVPQYFAVAAQAGGDGLQWVAFKTNGSPIMNQIVGKGGYFRGVPADVILNSYPGLTEEEAMGVKYGRGDEAVILSPRPEAI